jgi:hypothetical protein
MLGKSQIFCYTRTLFKLIARADTKPALNITSMTDGQMNPPELIMCFAVKTGVLLTRFQTRLFSEHQDKKLFWG